ncbi:cytochrome P450 [Periconia macrospinosa]|uniref:Bifunctional cytochrome P450/NADPH--P450 reductase n=1 Tax=Periconia macrospinosa TaxID=97972 RepID=A0A2V1D5K2_9PLEO|nr:cytochrome P450 [Periconia macrospinosa]
MCPSASPLASIPGPNGLPLLGNIFDIDPSAGLKSLVEIAHKYGPIFQITLGGQKQTFICDTHLLEEVCDESRFQKVVTSSVELLRMVTHDGLFTARENEHNWDVAHRILMPIFGPVKIREMFNQMVDIAQQLCLKWSRYGSTYPIEVTADFTRLTLDTIALCTMDHRFNSFYRDSSMHPFVDSMNRYLSDTGKRFALPELFSSLYVSANKRNKSDAKVMRDLCHELVEHRRQNQTDSDDILNTLIHQADPKTGEKLKDGSIVDNMITFLVAGHETTSGLLSFVFYYMLKHPEALANAQKEVDEIIGVEKVTVMHLPQLKYINAILRETLRLMPTAPVFTVGARKDYIIGGKYRVKKGEPLNALLPAVHCDPSVYGDDAAEWKPERMLDENFKNLPPNAWKPFGNGKRSCIGRAFAWQESLLVIAILLQKFNFTMDDPSYEVRIKEALTIKPDGFKMHAALRNSTPPSKLVPKTAYSSSKADKSGDARSHPNMSIAGPGNNRSVSIFYGSNSGTCEALSNLLAGDFAKIGFTVQPIRTLDWAPHYFTTNELIVIVTATYDGRPTDDATEFVDWLESLQGEPLKGVSYTVFGCGNHDWATTLYKIPKFIDSTLEKHGAKRLAPLGTANVALRDPLSELEKWEEENLWPALDLALMPSNSPASLESGLKVSFQQPYTQRKEFTEATVTECYELTTSMSLTRKCHMELRLPEGVTYTAGDYLAVLPLNPMSNVQRALSRFHMAWDSVLVIESTGPTLLPTATPISVADLFSTYVELAQPATSRNLKMLASAATEQSSKQALLNLANDDSATTPSTKLPSVLDLLEAYPSLPLPIETFLEMLPPLRPRTYSISSSPSFHPSHATLTWSVVHAPSWSGHGSFYGVASNHLSDLSPGAVVRVSVRRSNPAFHPPTDPKAHPIIMIASGSGLAPFRGFIQERAWQKKAGMTLAPAMLFVGCRGKDDDLYRSAMDEFVREGVVRVFRAYSRMPEQVDAGGCMYVQERVWAERREFAELWSRGAKVFVCGGSQMSEAIKEVFANIGFAAEGEKSGGVSPDEWFRGLDPGRYATEVFN